MVDIGKFADVIRRRTGAARVAPEGVRMQPSAVAVRGVNRDAVLEMAETAKSEGNYALSALYYEKAIEIWGENPDFRLNIAILQREMGQHGAATASLLNAIKQYPGDARFPLEMGELHRQQKQYDEAGQSYRRAARMAPDWPVPVERLLDLTQLAESERKRDAADEQERIDKEERLEMLSRFGGGEQVDTALFHPTRLELTQNHAPHFVTSFIGVHRRTRWGAGPVVRGTGSLRGYLVSMVPYHKIQIYIDGRLVHEGGLTVGPVQNERTDLRLKKYAFNAWIDFAQFSCGWHDVIFRAVGFAGGVEEGLNWKKESLIVDEPLPDGFFEEATARVPQLRADSSHSLIEQVRTLPSVVADATPNSYPGPIRNVAVLRLDGLGDVAVSVPFFLRLRELLPDANIVVLASADNADGCRALEIFDEVIEIDFPESPYKQGRFLGKEEQLALMERLAEYKFDLAITGMVSDGPRQLSIMTGAPVTIGFGGDDVKSLNIYYDTRDPKSGGNILNYAARYGMLTKALEVWLDSGARVQRRDDLSPHVLAQYGIEPGDKFVVMHTGSRIPATEWPGYAALANRIVAELGHKVVYIANDGTQKRFLSEQALSEGRIVFLTGIIPFDHFDAFLSYCSVFIGNDSGPGHLATLRGAKAIRIISARLGGSEWKSEMAGVCIFRRMPCAGCGAIPISRYEECTFDIACVKDITIDEVYDQVVRLSSGDGMRAISANIIAGEAA
jgi:ADP-heptose:LPS heptosyltransferase